MKHITNKVKASEKTIMPLHKKALYTWVLTIVIFVGMLIIAAIIPTPKSQWAQNLFLVLLTFDVAIGVVSFVVLAIWELKNNNINVWLVGTLVLGMLLLFIILVIYIASVNNTLRDSEYSRLQENLRHSSTTSTPPPSVQPVVYTAPPTSPPKKKELVRLDVPNTEDDIWCIPSTAIKLTPLFTKIEQYKKKDKASSECYEKSLKALEDGLPYEYIPDCSPGNIYDDWELAIDEANTLMQVGCYNGPDVYE